MTSIHLSAVSEDFVGLVNITLLGSELLMFSIPAAGEVLVAVCADEKVIGLCGRCRRGRKPFQHGDVAIDRLRVEQCEAFNR